MKCFYFLITEVTFRSINMILYSNDTKLGRSIFLPIQQFSTQNLRNVPLDRSLLTTFITETSKYQMPFPKDNKKEWTYLIHLN